MGTLAVGVHNGNMRTRLCVFNCTRESFLSLGVTLAETHLARLRGLLGRMRLRGDDGVWVVPCNGIHTIGMFFPIDLICLYTENRVVHLDEHVRPFRIVRPRAQCRSVLELPVRTIYSSHTKAGDHLLICTTEEMQKYLSEHQTRAPAWNPERDTGFGIRGRSFHERRAYPRIREPGLVVYYWDGGVPEPHRVLDISAGGVCIGASLAWHRGTTIEMVLQYEGFVTDAQRSIAVQSCIVRAGPGSTGLVFLHSNKVERRRLQTFLKQGVPGMAGRGRNGGSPTAHLG